MKAIGLFGLITLVLILASGCGYLRDNQIKGVNSFYFGGCSPEELYRARRLAILTDQEAQRWTRLNNPNISNKERAAIYQDIRELRAGIVSAPVKVEGTVHNNTRRWIEVTIYRWPSGEYVNSRRLSGWQKWETVLDAGQQYKFVYRDLNTQEKWKWVSKTPLPSNKPWDAWLKF
jgi:hypothetical protein